MFVNCYMYGIISGILSLLFFFLIRVGWGYDFWYSYYYNMSHSANKLNILAHLAITLDTHSGAANARKIRTVIFPFIFKFYCFHIFKFVFKI